jgi:hypothetical protein
MFATSIVTRHVTLKKRQTMRNKRRKASTEKNKKEREKTTKGKEKISRIIVDSFEYTDL